MNETKKTKYARLDLRVTPKEKERITAKAERCGLSTTEYIRQRALEYEPRAAPPDALFSLLEKIGDLENKTASPALDTEIGRLLKEIAAVLLLPRKDRETWPSPDSGPSAET